MKNEAKYFETCRSCGQAIDLRCLPEVLHHDRLDHRALTNAQRADLGMPKKRFSFAQMDVPAVERSIGTAPRMFLASMVVWAGLSGLFLPIGLAAQGPVKQLATRLAQEWHVTIQDIYPKFRRQS